MSSFQLQNSVMLSRLKPFGILFEKSLSDLIKGIRSHSKESPESLLQFLDAAILECKDELSTTDLETKATAVLKLAYLEMYGFDMTWCNFQILELMSSANFQQKRIGYLAAVQSFKSEQDLLILATNQFKKDLNSHNHIVVGLALSGIATIVTPNLSKDIHDDVLLKLNHSSPYIRKKAILAMYKIFLQYPDSLRQDFTRIIEKLDDTDVSVVSATINVICEISKKNPHIFMNYLPKFFTILEETENNWMIIRILKLFQSLSKVEPRMKKKILPIILNMMLATDALSLKYECINCMVSGSMLSLDSHKDKDVAKECLKVIIINFFRGDTNLHFVGLIALINILKMFPSLMHEVDGIAGTVKSCLKDNDIIIKQKALEVCQFLVNESNMVEIVKVLLLQIIPTEETTVSESLKMDVTSKILEVASLDNYANVPNFEWYIAVLNDITNLTLLPLPSSANTVISSKTSNAIASLIGKEYKILASRIPSIRPNILVKVILKSLLDIKVLQNCPLLLKDFYFILGEYIDDLRPLDDSDSDDDEDEEPNHKSKNYEENTPIYFLGKKIQLLNALINNQVDKSLNLTNSPQFPISLNLISLPQTDVLIVLIQALVKLYNGIVTDYIRFYAVGDGKLNHGKLNELKFYLFKLINFLTNWENHENYEVQERTLSWLEFLKLVLEALTNGDLSDVQRLQKEEIDYYDKLSKEQVVSKKTGSDDDDDLEEEDEDDDSEEEESSADDVSPANPDNDYEEFESSSSEEEEDEDEEETEVKPADNLIDISVDEPQNEELTVDDNVLESLPVLLTHVLPSFFKVYELNPISGNAQRNIAVPLDLDLDTEINETLDYKLLGDSNGESDDDSLLFSEGEVQDSPDDSIASPLSNSEEISRKKERLERLKDDPYYITSGNYTGKKSKKIKNIMDEVEKEGDNSETNSINLLNDDNVPKQKPSKSKSKGKKMKKEKVVILSEEVVNNPSASNPDIKALSKPKKKNVLKIDSSNLDNFDLNSSSISDNVSTFDNPAEYDIDLEALRKKLADDTSKAAEVIVKKKKKKSSKSETGDEEKKKKKKKKVVAIKSEVVKEETPTSVQDDESSAHKIITVEPKKKAKKKAKIIE